MPPDKEKPGGQAGSSHRTSGPDRIAALSAPRQTPVTLTSEQRETKRRVDEIARSYRTTIRSGRRTCSLLADFYSGGWDQHLVDRQGNPVEHSQAWIARACGCSQQAITRLERSLRERWARLESAKKAIHAS